MRLLASQYGFILKTASLNALLHSRIITRGVILDALMT